MNTFYPNIPTVLSDGTELPRYAHEGDAAVDLVSNEDVTLMPGEWKKVGSGVSCAIPKGFVGIVVPRSGLGCKGLVLKNGCGVIDSGYRGEIGLTLYNNNPTHVWCDLGSDDGSKNEGWVYNCSDVLYVRKGDRVAQMLILPVAQATFAKVDSLDETERGTGGFGSSGTRERL